ncbi:hypothetical protein FN846DRAFT_381006 [Sphaerosporella brunnea]|uniref:Uncharacterized protein n=1 Tax=Sphaerosporella brunnea TaxID=1250544 RepID=A0A5J5F614_9PEZI|nr:hypothetical protein FN846DRAFT_381006 [Sphaerosporella brunnea]
MLLTPISGNTRSTHSGKGGGVCTAGWLGCRVLQFARSLGPSTMSSSGEQQQAEAHQQPWTGGDVSGGGGESSSSSSNGTAGDGVGGGGSSRADTAGGGGGGGGGSRNKAALQDPHNNGARAALTNEIRSEFFRLYEQAGFQIPGLSVQNILRHKDKDLYFEGHDGLRDFWKQTAASRREILQLARDGKIRVVRGPVRVTG